LQYQNKALASRLSNQAGEIKALHS